jgi:hypothetical protein
VQQDLQSCREALEVEPSGADLLRLYDAANANGPISPLLVTFAHPMSDEPCFELSSFAALNAARRYRRERRAQKLFDAVPDLVEKVYGRYLRSMWALSFLAEGRWPSRPPGAFGALAQQASARLRGLGTLTDADAGHFRNAVQHRDARYIPYERAVELVDGKDRSRPSPSDWGMILTLEAFEARLTEMWRVAVPLMTKLRSVVTVDLLLRSGLVAAWPLLRNALLGDAQALSALGEQNLDAAMRSEIIRSSPPTAADFWFLPPESDPATWSSGSTARASAVGSVAISE